VGLKPSEWALKRLRFYARLLLIVASTAKAFGLAEHRLWTEVQEKGRDTEVSRWRGNTEWRRTNHKLPVAS